MPRGGFQAIDRRETAKETPSEASANEGRRGADEIGRHSPAGRSDAGSMVDPPR